MMTEKELVKEIMLITSKIQEEFPELSTHLSETPVKTQEMDEQTVSLESLNEYRNSLNTLYEQFLNK